MREKAREKVKWNKKRHDVKPLFAHSPPMRYYVKRTDEHEVEREATAFVELMTPHRAQRSTELHKHFVLLDRCSHCLIFNRFERAAAIAARPIPFQRPCAGPCRIAFRTQFHTESFLLAFSCCRWYSCHFQGEIKIRANLAAYWARTNILNEYIRVGLVLSKQITVVSFCLW